MYRLRQPSRRRRKIFRALGNPNVTSLRVRPGKPLPSLESIKLLSVIEFTNSHEPKLAVASSLFAEAPASKGVIRILNHRAQSKGSAHLQSSMCTVLQDV